MKKFARPALFVSVLCAAFVLGVALTSAAGLGHLLISDLAERITASTTQESLPVEEGSPVPAEPVSAVTGETTPEHLIHVDSFDPSGSYVFGDEKVSAPFSDIEWIDIVTRGYRNEDGEWVDYAVVPSGKLWASKPFRFGRFAYANLDLTFQTETIGGVSYRFVGRFRNPNLEYDGPPESYPPDLTGTLIKIRNGKWAAETKVAFYAAGC